MNAQPTEAQVALAYQVYLDRHAPAAAKAAAREVLKSVNHIVLTFDL